VRGASGPLGTTCVWGAGLLRSKQCRVFSSAPLPSPKSKVEIESDCRWFVPCGFASKFYAVREPAEPGWMHTEHAAHFGALFLRAFAARKAFEQDSGLGLWFGQFSPGCLDAKLVEEFDEDLEVLVHSNC